MERWAWRAVPAALCVCVCSAVPPPRRYVAKMAWDQEKMYGKPSRGENTRKGKKQKSHRTREKRYRKRNPIEKT